MAKLPDPVSTPTVATEAEAKKIFRKMDKDGDGEITKEEFISHFEVNKGFSPIAGSESSPTKSAVVYGTICTRPVI